MSKRLTLAQMMASGLVIPAMIYGRVSSEKQLHGEGLVRQSKGGFEWIAKHPEYNIRVDAELEDRARSAWKGDNATADDAALASILKQVERGELTPPLMLIMESLDRFSREDRWTANARLSGLVARGIWVVTTKDDQVYSSESNIGDLIMSIVLLDAAHAHSQTTSERVHKTKLMHVQNAMAASGRGEQPNLIHQNVPAWMVVREAISTTNRAIRKAELLSGPCHTIATIYPLALHHGSDWITRWLLDRPEEHPPFGKTGKWSLRVVKRILRSKAVIGHLEGRHGIIERAYPRVPGVSDELWLAVQAAQDNRKDAGSPTWKTNNHNLLVGIGRCASCGGKMRLTVNGQTGHYYYGCRNRALMGKSTCTSTCRYRQDVIDNAILHRFGLGWLEAQPIMAKPADVSKLTAECDKLRRRQKQLEVAMQDPDEDLDAIRKALSALRSKVFDAQARLKAAREQEAVAKAVVKIADITDRAELATALRPLLTRVTFLPDSVVEIESQSHVLTVVARRDGDKPQLAIKDTGRRPPMPVHLRHQPPVTVTQPRL